MKVIVTGLLVAALGYLVLVAFVYFRQEKLLYFPNLPSRELDASPADIGLAFESITFKAEDDIELHGWFIPHPQSQAVALFCHGNAGNISHRLPTIQAMHDLGLSVFIFDYRGYGRSSGHASEEGTYRDARAAWKYLRENRGLNEQDIIIWGRSLGAAVAVNLAATQTSSAVIIESTFTSVTDLAAMLYPHLPVRYISRFHYNVLTSVKAIHAPILIVHSHDDEIIPFAHGERLFAAANEPKQFLAINGTHDDAASTSKKEYVAKVAGFLRLPVSMRE